MRLLLLKCKTAHFSIPNSCSSLEFGITGYYNPGHLPHAESQDIDLSSCAHFHFLLHCVITIISNATYGQTDRRRAFGISAMSINYIAYCTKNASINCAIWERMIQSKKKLSCNLVT